MDNPNNFPQFADAKNEITSDVSNHVSPETNRSNKKRKERTNDEYDTCFGVSETCLHLFPFNGVRAVIDDTFKTCGIDPRGSVTHTISSLPKDYCEACRCKKELCHDTRFGLYCGLRVAEQVQKLGAGSLFGDKIDELLSVAYNEVLRVVTVQEIGILDTHGTYEIPSCMKRRSWMNIMRHFYYQKFTAGMESRLRDGSQGSEGNGTYIFFNAFRRDNENK